MKETNERTLAVLTIHDAGDMSPGRRNFLAEWLRDQAKSIKKDGDNYAKRFRARYIVTTRKNPVG